MSFSSSSGGTLALPSPTTSIHGDTGPAARNLRRSMSRSPSRFHLMRAESHNSQLSDSSSSSTQIPSPCPQTHTSTPPDAPLPSSLSTSSLASSGSAEYDISSSTSRAIAVPLLGALQTQQSIFSTPLRSSLKLSVRSARPKTTSSKPASRPRLSPKSPLKRALSVNSDMGNSAPPSPARAAGPSTALSEPLLGQENGGSRSRLSGLLLGFNSPPHNGPDKQSRHSMHLDLSRDARADTLASTICSPLKRSDAIMNFDHSNAGSPVAKRRSLHGIASLGTDFNVFDFASPNTAPPPRTSFDIHDDSSYNHELGTTPVPSSSSADGGEPALLAPVPSGPAKRASSLRKSTFQRHDSRSSWGRRQGEKYLAQQQQLLQQASPSAQAQPKRASHEWLFTTPHIRNKPRASLDQLLKPEPRDSPFKGRGPLPNPSLHSVDQHAAPTGAPAHHPHPLSRTLTTSSSGSSFMDDSPTHFPVQLPPDRPRPTSIFARSLPLNTHRPRPDPVSTPQYKSARPLQSVFASAGLVSKMNKNGDDEALQREGGKPMVMPDTPCKKQVYPSNTYPPSSGSGRKQQQRRFFFSVGSEGPGPFNNAGAHPRRTPATNAGENVVNFFKLRSSHARKGSILSIDGDASDSQGAVDGFDLPPTPTKSVLAKNLFGSANKGGVTPIAVRDLSLGSVSFTPEVTAHIPSPITGSSPSSSSSSDKMSPKTPREHSILHSIDFTSSNMAPPDASRLSISNNAPRNVPKASISLPTAKPSQAIFPPATPTTDREAFINFMDRRVSITPVHGKAPKDTDAVLSSMFGKVECVGKGEFSQVYRVNARNGLVHRRSASFDYFSLTPSKRAPSSRADNLSPSSTPKVFAVKKVRLPYFGQKEREAKLREVAVLEAVRGRENVLQISDHWEQNGHLYIQTEYCDEGGLDSFLKKVGEHGRLDDFRIWKILLEVSQVCLHLCTLHFMICS